MKNNDYHNKLLESLPESYKVWFREEKMFLDKTITPNSLVLEVGCGDGRSVVDLIPITKNIVGIDHDSEAIERVKEKFYEYDTLKFIEAEASAMPFEDDSFDFVLCMGCFMNFADKKFLILKEIQRVLKKNGKIIISTFSENALEERLKAYRNLNGPIKEVSENGTVIFDQSLGDNVSEQFSKEQLVEIFNQAGLKIDNIIEVNIAYICELSK